MIALGLTLPQQIDSTIAMRWFEILRSHHWPGPVINGRRQYTVQARNIIVQEFIERDWTPLRHDTHYQGELEALLFWDSDQLPPLMIPQLDGSTLFFNQHLDKLLRDNKEKQVIAGLYYSRNSQFITKGEELVEMPHEPVAYERNPNGSYSYLSYERMVNEILAVPQRLELHEIGGAGTGAMLIRKELLVRMAAAKAPLPIFEAPPAGELAEMPGLQWTEDLYFCEQVTQLLHEKIWLDSAGVSAHQGDRIWIADQHYLAAHGQIGMKSPQAIAQLTENLPQRRIITPRDILH